MDGTFRGGVGVHHHGVTLRLILSRVIGYGVDMHHHGITLI